MRVIKFTTGYEKTLSFDNKKSKEKYEEKIGNIKNYMPYIDNEIKHLAICPKCNNPVIILGIYKKILQKPHARHIKGVNIQGVAEYNEYRYLRCPNHKKKSDYVKEYVLETDESAKRELYKIAHDHFDKAIYLLSKTTGITITNEFAERLAENYVFTNTHGLARGC